jgi:hypothetical protein
MTVYPVSVVLQPLNWFGSPVAPNNLSAGVNPDTHILRLCQASGLFRPDSTKPLVCYLAYSAPEED